MKKTGETKSLTDLVAYYNIAFALIFAFVAFWLLGIDGANYLRKIDLLSIFISTNEYFWDCMALPGGLLVWCATFLTQTFYYPWLGAIIYIILLLAMAWLGLKAFNLRPSMFPAALLMPAIALLALLNFGYIIFSMKTPGFAFTLPLGVNLCLLAFWAYRKLINWVMRLCALVVIAIAGYCLLGFYGLLLTAMCLVFEIASITKSSKQNSLLIVIGLAAIIFMPKIWFSAIGGDLPMAQIYKYPLPFFYENEGAQWVPYIVLFVLMLGGCCVPALSYNKLSRNKLSSADQEGKDEPRYITVLALVAGAVAIIGVLQLRYADPNFKLTLDMDNAIGQERWEEALDLISKEPEMEPTRVNVVMSDIALLRLGRAPHQIFKMPIGSAPYKTTRDLRATHDIMAMPFAYHMGLANYAYRWAMEYEVEYGRSVERLKYMVKTALLNKDYELARKNLDNLSKTLFHKKWTEKYYAYLDNPDLIKQDSELGAILPLVGSEDKFLDDNNTLEGYVWKALASIEMGQFEAVELALISALVCFRPDLFAEVAPIYAQNVKDLPVHFQEGVLMWSLINNNDYYRPFKINKSVMERFELFKRMLQQTSSLPQEARKERMRQMFGDTYWFYCMFVNDLKII